MINLANVCFTAAALYCLRFPTAENAVCLRTFISLRSKLRILYRYKDHLRMEDSKLASWDAHATPTGVKARLRREGLREEAGPQKSSRR